MKAVEIILSNNEFIPAFFLKLKIQKAENNQFCHFLVYVLLLCENN